MPFVVNRIVYLDDDIWTPPEGLYGIDVIVRGAGGSGSTGRVNAHAWSYSVTNPETQEVTYYSGTSYDYLPGVGGGGGGAAISEQIIRVEKLPPGPIEVVVGKGAPRTIAPGGNLTFVPGENGGDSRFGDLFFAGGGGGGGRSPYWQQAQGSEFGGQGGYAPTRGGQGSTYNTAWYARSIHSICEWHTLAGGGGGGRGEGTIQTDGSQGNDPPATFPVPWMRGGGSGSAANHSANNGNAGAGYPSHWEWLQSGCGGNGGGGDGGFPSGGGGGGNAITVAGGSRDGGAGADGCVTVLEYFFVNG